MTYINETQVVQVDDSILGNLYVQVISGLNIFDANNVVVHSSEDPTLRFFETLSELFVCSAHVGDLGLRDIVSDPAQLFDAPESKTSFIRTPVSISRGTFYEYEGESSGLSCFIPKAGKNFWSVRTEDGIDSLEYALRTDSLALYVDGSIDNTHKMEMELHPVAVEHKNWLRRAVSLYPVVVTTGYDGWRIIAYSSSPIHFSKLLVALDKAVDLIKVSSWYRVNTEELRWDSGDDRCLKLRPNKI